MNILFQVCGLIIIILLFIIYKTQKNLNLYTDRVFTINLINAICTLSFDALSVIAIFYKEKLPNVLVNIACKTYLISMVCSGFCALFYVLVGVVKEKTRMKAFRISMGIIGAQALAIALTPIEIVSNNGLIYTQGISVYLCYAFTLIYIVMTIITAIGFLFKKNSRRAVAVLVWMGFWCIAAIIQLLKPDFLVVAFAGALGMLVLYVMLQTPESFLDKQYACFNSYSFNLYLNDRKDYEKRVAILAIDINDKKVLKESFFHPIKTPGKIIKWISKNSDVLIFKNVDYSIYLVHENPEKLKELYEKFILNYSSYKIGEFLGFTLIENSDWFENSVELDNIFKYAKSVGGIKKNELLTINSNILEGYKNELLVAEDIKKALLEDRICVFFQPIYSFLSKKFDTAEALVRMIDENGNIVSPGKFIPIAEKTGLIIELGDRIFKKVCQFMASNDLNNLGIHYIEVNLSVVQCENELLYEQILTTMQEYGISPEKVNFEITETGSVTTRIPLIENMNKLTDEGLSFTLDDFGKGESNLSYLIDMPVSILKLDYDITKAYYQNKKAKHAIEHIVNLAHKLGIKVVAEGIETSEELKIFENVGVDYIQGFVFSKAIPANEYLSFIKEKNLNNKNLN